MAALNEKMKAKFISTQGTYLEAIIEIEGQRYCVMDEITLDLENMPILGETFDFEFSNMLDEDEVWESMFRGNPSRKMCVEQIAGWKYSAYGKIVSINPVRVDCGLLVEEDVLHTNDPEVIGEYITFTISRLGGYVI